MPGFRRVVGYAAGAIDPTWRVAISRMSCAAVSPTSCRCRKSRSASPRPTSAAASATRQSSQAKKSASAGSRCGSTIPVRWLEDRREMLVANANCREHHYAITAYADRSGKILALRRGGRRRHRRLFLVAVHGGDRGLAGQRHPARPLRYSRLPLHRAGPSQRTSRRIFRIAASRGRACASRWR